MQRAGQQPLGRRARRCGPPGATGSAPGPSAEDIERSRSSMGCGKSKAVLDPVPLGAQHGASARRSSLDGGVRGPPPQPARRARRAGA